MRTLSLVCIAIFLISSGKVSAQLNNDSTDTDQIVITGNNYETDQIDVPSKALIKNRKVQTGLEVGTSFTYSPGNFAGPSFYVAPNLFYRINPRFTVQAGIGIERSSFFTLYNNDGNETNVLPMTRAFIYAKGSYLVSSHITVDGTIYKTINDVPKLTKYSPAIRYNQNGAIVGINYKLNNSLSIGFHVQMTNGSYQSQSSDPFSRPYFGF